METEFDNLAYYTLISLIQESKDGDWGEAESKEDFLPYYIIRGTDFDDAYEGKIGRIPLRFISKSSAERRTLKEDDILIETAGGTKEKSTGKVTIITKRLLSKNLLPFTCASFARFIRINTERSSPRFIFWYLRNMYNNGEMWQHQVQHTGIARFQYTKFAESLKIPLPPLHTQKAIAHILGTLDDKIELLRQMNETLEAMAKALFQSWFVDFDPVRKKADGITTGLPKEIEDLFPSEFEDSELVEIPKGWKVGKLGDYCSVKGGYAYKSNIFLEDGLHPVIKIKNIKEDGSIDLDDVLYIDENEAKKTKEFWLNDGDVVMAMTGATIGKYAIVINRDNKNNSVLNQRVALLNPINQTKSWYIYSALITTDIYDQVVNKGIGSAQPNISGNDIMACKSIYPGSYLIKAFNIFVNRFFELIIENHKKLYQLSNLRDSLLPKLISGELDLSDKMISAILEPAK